MTVGDKFWLSLLSVYPYLYIFVVVVVFVFIETPGLCLVLGLMTFSIFGVRPTLVPVLRSSPPPPQSRKSYRSYFSRRGPARPSDHVPLGSLTPPEETRTLLRFTSVTGGRDGPRYRNIFESRDPLLSFLVRS